MHMLVCGFVIENVWESCMYDDLLFYNSDEVIVNVFMMMFDHACHSPLFFLYIKYCKYTNTFMISYNINRISAISGGLNAGIYKNFLF